MPEPSPYRGKRQKAARPPEPPPPRLLRGARRPGLLALALGFVLLAIQADMILDEGVYLPRAVGFGVVATIVGSAMVIAPGRVDLPLYSRRRIPLTELFDGLEPWEENVWIAAGVGGILLGFAVSAMIGA